MLYVIAVLLANYTATWFIPFPVFGMVAVGTLIFGITFTQRDRAHALGRKKVYTMIAIAALGSAAESVFMGVPWRIVLASVLAIVLSETADTEVYQKFITRTWWRRVMTSNAVSIPLDSIVFNLIAFAGVFPVMLLVSIIFGEIVTKPVVGALWAIKRTNLPPFVERMLAVREQPPGR